MSRRVVTLAGRKLSLANLEKDLYPPHRFTKASVLDYYRRAAEFILPHLEGRALTLKRYPDGVKGEFFFEKRCPSHRPAWVPTARVAREEGPAMTVCLVNDLETLMWVGNLASLELHVPLAGVSAPGTPDYLVFDLDPGEGAGVAQCARVALILRGLLERLGLAGLVKSSGKKGLHLYVPLRRPGTGFAETKRFSRAVAETLEREHPGLVTSRMAKESRKGKVFINWSQNDPSKTMVCVYSLRASPRPAVSFPLAWEELEGGAAGRGLPVSPREALRRLERSGDLFRDLLRMKQRLPRLREVPT